MCLEFQPFEFDFTVHDENGKPPHTSICFHPFEAEFELSVGGQHSYVDIQLIFDLWISSWLRQPVEGFNVLFTE